MIPFILLRNLASPILTPELLDSEFFPPAFSYHQRRRNHVVFYYRSVLGGPLFFPHGTNRNSTIRSNSRAIKYQILYYSTLPF